MDMDLPPAPTPPVNSMNMASNSDRTANLLNLLKFSGASQRHQNQNQSQVAREQQGQNHSAPQPQPGQQPLQLQHHDQPPQMTPNFPQSQREFPALIHQPAPTAADPTGLLAALMRGTHESEEPKQLPPIPQQQQQQQQPPPPQQSSNSFDGGEPNADTRSFLLNLLNRPKPSQGDQPLLTEATRSSNLTPGSPDHASEASRHYGPYPQHQYQQQQQQSSPYHSAPQYQQHEVYSDVAHPPPNVESYPYPPQQDQPADVSVLYQLMGSLAQQSSPQSQRSQRSQRSQGHHAHSPNAMPFQILKKDSPAGSQHAIGSERSPLTSPPNHIHRKADRASSFNSHPSAHHETPPVPEPDNDGASDEENAETVADAVSDIAEQVDQEAREALERAEHERAQAEIAEDLEDMLNAKTEEEFEESAQLAAQEILAELDKEENHGVLEEALPPDVAEAVREIVDETAQGVADSWESADQDEIVVIEESEPPPVRVFNFPMKPWISITISEEGTEPRPHFSDDSIMDIARLRKDFDQIDRNLYTATSSYMAYGMSKQGGLRVIRQEDGKDAKIFTDTKDRIFNVNMCVTPEDHDGAHRETIVGTGISGTVYWVQIKDGEKDHIDDAHLEQYGFALPPMSSQEGDAPGGVLKTRARTSTNHPEFFAVGRGKTINFVWPSYIMQNNLFKPGHDRVVDTEKLAKQYSSRINTGKAGKDFTFSQDDSVVVSLDKSGRVKFWDVTNVLATEEDCDPRAPVPRYKAMEVKEPLLTLSSTPEGEKAWPTSVMLLDKSRPYQKRCALRYMIVGMKQNHTLQLWDLALGKPVQDFNLPHSKESDAVCSVMYHPTTGMIVIGHPTRNSIYLAHLSAPKYNLKSVSQADYITRIAFQDSSIPQPDSTAVISGVREYSFSNRGILRSLDILSTPAMVQETDMPTLFELYAMHSKGVACLLIRQAELGWAPDNKVLAPVDAVSAGAITVSKLKPTPPAEAAFPTDGPHVRVVQSKDIENSTPPTYDAVPQSSEPATPAKGKNEPKPVETPAPQAKEPSCQNEKPERKQRKKKNAANQGDAANGGSNSTRANKDAGKGAHQSVESIPKAISPKALESALDHAKGRIIGETSDMLDLRFAHLREQIDQAALERDDKFNQHQLNLLDSVSAVLNENTQQVLQSLITEQFNKNFIPAIGDKATKAVNDVLSNKLQPNVASAVQKEIRDTLPHALNRALRSGDFVKAVTDRVSNSVSNSISNSIASSMQQEFSNLSQRLNGTFTNIASQASQRVAGELHQQYHEQFEIMKAQHAADANKIDQLLSYVTRLTDMVSTMAASQSSLQAEFLKFKQQPVHELPGASGVQGPQGGHGHGMHPQPNYGMMHGNHAPSHTGSFAASQAPSNNQPYMGSPQYTRGHQQQMNSPHASVPASENVGPVNNVNALASAYANQMSQSDAEADNDLLQRIRLIEQLIQEGRLQDAMLQWIQSGREEEIFHRCLSRFPPSKFENLPPIMLLVVVATISKDLKPNPRLKEEVDWIEMAIRAFADTMGRYEWEKAGYRDVMKSTSQTMQLLISRVQPLLAGIQDGFPTDPFLVNLEKGKLEWIVRASEQVLETINGARRYE